MIFFLSIFSHLLLTINAYNYFFNYILFLYSFHLPVDNLHHLQKFFLGVYSWLKYHKGIVCQYVK
jgi:hypothetical protein